MIIKNKNMLKTGQLVCLLVALALVLPCIWGLNVAEAKNNIVRIGWMESPPGGMNPFLVRNEGSYLFMTLMYEPLLVPMMDGTITPWLAKKWEYKPGDKTWLFYLDERAKWSDGKPVTADDVKFTFETAFKYNFPLGSRSKAIIDTISVVNAKTVAFKVKQEFAAFLNIAGSSLIMPKHIWEKVEKVDQSENPNPIGSGPFLFKKYEPRAYMHVVRDPKYWRGPAKIDGVVIQVFNNQEAQVVALKKGELDIIPDLSGGETLIPPLVGDSNVKVMIDRWPHILYIAVNHRIAPLNNKEFRKAIDIAVNKKEVILTALSGYGELPLMGYVPPLVTKWANPKVTWRGLQMTDEARLQEANAILDKLGFPKGSDGIRLKADGKPLEFSVRCYSNASYVRASELIKNDLEKIGIKLRVEVTDPETLYGGIIYSGKRNMDWDLLVHGSTMDPDPDHFAREYAPEPPTPWENAPAFGWENEEIQSMLKQSRREMNEKKRIELLMKIQEKFADELVVVTLGHRFHPAAYRTDKYVGWNPARIVYGGMFHPLASIVNLLSVRPK